MAEEIKKVLSIQFDGRETISDVKQQVADLKKELDACVVGSKEAEDKSQELAQAQQKLKAAMAGAIDNTGKLTNTYHGLVTQMNKLKAAQKQVDVSTKAGRKEYELYAKEINSINDKLKDLDASNGVFSRNVGNYANSIKSAMGSMGGAVTTAFQSITNSLKALVSNPWVALIAAIVFAIKELIDAIKRNEEAMDGVNKVFNAFKAAYVVVQRVFDDLVKAVINAKDTIKSTFDSIKQWVKDVWKTVEPYAEKVGNFFGTIKGFFVSYITFLGDFWDTVVKTAIKGASYVKAAVEAMFTKKTFQEALDETQAAWLQGWEDIKEGTTKILENIKEGVSDAIDYIKDNYKDANKILDEITSSEQRLAEQHIANTKKIAENNKKIAELNAIVADRENNSVEDREKALEEAAKLQKENIEIEKKEAQERLRILKLKHSLNQSNNEDLQEEADLQAQVTNLEAQEAEVDRNVAAQKKALAKDRIKQAKEILNTEINAINQQLSITQKGSDEYLNLTRQRLTKQKELAILDAQERIKDEQELRKALLLIDAEYDQKELKAIEEQQQALADARNLAANNKAAQAKLENGSASMQYYQAELDAARTYYDNLFQLQGESDEEYKARQIAALQDVKDAEENLNNQRLSNYMAVAGGIADIMSTVASAWEDSIKRRVEAGEISEEEGEKEFENVKAMQIAVATINTISGAIAAFMKSQELGQPWGMIIGAIQAAAVTAAGIAEIAKIKSTTLSSGGGSSPSAGGSSFQLPAVENYTPDYTQNLTGASDMQDLSGTITSALEQASIRAFVVESDITDAQKKTNKRQQETTW